MQKHLFFCACMLSFFLLFNCNKSKLTNGYSHNTEGFYYKLITFGDGNKSSKSNDVLIFDASFYTQNDSLFLDTKHDLHDGAILLLNHVNQSPNLKAYLANLTEGDSISLMLNPVTFFKSFFDTIAPSFCKNDSLIIANIKLTQVISFAEYTDNYINLKNCKELDDEELDELVEIDRFLKSKKITVNADNYGIYWLDKKETNLTKVEAGKTITIELKGQFLDGKVLTAKPQYLTFVFGTPDQTVKGLNIVIGTLKLGEYVKIILPSRLAFGENGSTNGAISPYTPLIYELKIIDIN